MHSKKKGHVNNIKLENELYHKNLLLAILPLPFFYSCGSTYRLGPGAGTRLYTRPSIIGDEGENPYFEVYP